MKASWWGYLGLIVWAGSILFGLQWYSQQQITLFDPDFALQQAASEPDFDQDLYAALQDAGAQGASLVHFESSASCYCNRLSQPHYELLSQQLRYLGPYAVGYGCMSGKTLISTIASLSLAETATGTAVAAEAQGCFCHHATT